MVGAAIDLLDRVGLDGLSLRRLATELGVQAPALYWHVKNKDELLELMVQAIIEETPPPEIPSGQGWEATLRAHMRYVRTMINRHRDGAMLIASTRPTDEQWPAAEALLGALVAQGLSPADGLRALIVASNFVSGFTLDEQADRARGRAGDQFGQEDWAAALRQLDPYPLLREALREVGDPQSDQSFEAGVQLILDGVRQRIAARS